MCGTEGTCVGAGEGGPEGQEILVEVAEEAAAKQE